MSNRESAIQEVQQANASMQRNKERFAAARASSGAAASAMRAEQKMASVSISSCSLSNLLADFHHCVQAEDRMKSAREQVNFIASSLKVESKRMDSGKTEDFKSALLALANTELEYYMYSRLAWESIVPALEVSDEEVNESQQNARRSVKFRKPGEPTSSVGQIIGLL
jgi:hypothetical protein